MKMWMNFVATSVPRRVPLRRGAPWARATKNVKEPPGEKGCTFKNKNVTLGLRNIFDFLNVHPFLPGHLLESNMCR